MCSWRGTAPSARQSEHGGCRSETFDDRRLPSVVGADEHREVPEADREVLKALEVA
jgi:hypothetical protein